MVSASRSLLLVLGAAALFAVRVVAIEDCCYGTQCAPPDPNQCILMAEGNVYTCARTCSGECTQGNGCCQWMVQTCEYMNKFPTATCPGNSQQNIAVNWFNNRYCRPQGQGNEVDCLQTATNWCKE